MTSFSTRIIDWQQREGRHSLPWQATRDPYRIWLSEVMLQQTQVSAVIPYFTRFLARFPDVHTLAAAPLDDVMQLWAGLGYYARARNLHRAAQQIVREHGGVFPRTPEAVKQLPGIGRSTAAAICAFAWETFVAILDGNAKRVLTRHFGVEGDTREKTVETKLWQISTEQLPSTNIEGYTQGLMDLGATVCVRHQPACLLCPLKTSCVAFAQGRVDELPGRGVKREVPHRQTQMLVLIASGEVLLERRPPTGIWGGLWSLPEVGVEVDALSVAKTRFGIKGRTHGTLDQVNHGFTHYSLSIFPVEIRVSARPQVVQEAGVLWLAIDDAVNAAIPTPVKKILRALQRGKS